MRKLLRFVLDCLLFPFVFAAYLIVGSVVCSIVALVYGGVFYFLFGP
jgi:hypothetical protein